METNKPKRKETTKKPLLKKKEETQPPKVASDRMKISKATADAKPSDKVVSTIEKILENKKMFGVAKMEAIKNLLVEGLNSATQRYINDTLLSLHKSEKAKLEKLSKKQDGVNVNNRKMNIV